jgi:hypothetical protein
MSQLGLQAIMKPEDTAGSYRDFRSVELKELKGNRGKDQIMRIVTDDLVDF